MAYESQNLKFLAAILLTSGAAPVPRTRRGGFAEGRMIGSRGQLVSLITNVFKQALYAGRNQRTAIFALRLYVIESKWDYCWYFSCFQLSAKCSPKARRLHYQGV